MGRLDMELKEMGHEPTDGECPECDGVLWRNSHELVCSTCAIVVDGDDSVANEYDSWFEYFQSNRDEYCYDNSERRRCIGAFLGNFDWGPTGNSFEY